MDRILASVAVIVSGALSSACSASGAAGVSQQLCALASACGEGTSAFGQTCEEIQAEASLGTNGTGTDQALISAELSCVESASDCASFQACLTVPASAAAACKGIGSVCSGGYVVRCGAELGGLTEGDDCMGAGLVCVEGGDGASCGTASCDSTTTKPTCDGDNLVTCQPIGGFMSTTGVLSSDSCNGSMSSECSLGPGGGNCQTAVGQTCGVVSGVAMCVGTGAACDQTTSKNSCNGTVMTTCTGGALATYDCTTEDPNATCQIGSGGDAQCVGAGTACTDKTPETCANGVITYCSWGTITTVDCTSYGLSGCKMVTTLLGGQMSAACTP
jgi:hypothetical protein